MTARLLAVLILLLGMQSLAITGKTVMKHIDFADITAGGILKDRAELSFKRLQEEYFCWPSISKVNFAPFPGDAIGRNINGLTLLCMALHRPAPSNLQEIMRRLPELQNTDGYLGPKLPDSRANEDVLAAHNGLACGLSEYVMWTKDDQASLYRNDTPAANVPAETRILFEAMKHDRISTVCGLLWRKPQVVTQVVLQWPDDSPLPDTEAIVVRWSVAGTVRESAIPGVIGNGRQWVYTLDRQGQSIETDNIVVAFKGKMDTSPRTIPTVSVVGR